jgi:hypothetical protein
LAVFHPLIIGGGLRRWFFAQSGDSITYCEDPLPLYLLFTAYRFIIVFSKHNSCDVLDWVYQYFTAVFFLMFAICM